MRGITLIEALFSVSIFLVISLGLFEAYRALQLSVAASESKLFALEAVRERMELGRNTDFSNLNSLAGTQSVMRGGYTFALTTTVANIDDQFDGLAPIDTDPVDFKQIEVGVTCSMCRKFTPITITGRFAP